LFHVQYFVWVSSWLPSQLVTYFHSVFCSEDNCYEHYTVMTVMSLVSHPLNHDRPEHFPEFAAYCRETDQPKDKCHFVNQV
jgi:hypothetical protein